MWVEDADELHSILDSNTDVVVDFTAPGWCVPCQRFAPHYDSAARKSEATFVAVDVDKAPWAMVDYGIQSVPTVKMFRNGEYLTDLVKSAQDKTVIKLLAEINNA